MYCAEIFLLSPRKAPRFLFQNIKPLFISDQQKCSKAVPSK